MRGILIRHKKARERSESRISASGFFSRERRETRRRWVFRKPTPLARPPIRGTFFGWSLDQVECVHASPNICRVNHTRSTAERVCLFHYWCAMHRTRKLPTTALGLVRRTALGSTEHRRWPALALCDLWQRLRKLPDIRIAASKPATANASKHPKLLKCFGGSRCRGAVNAACFGDGVV